jgi:hypothetical protein
MTVSDKIIRSNAASKDRRAFHIVSGWKKSPLMVSSSLFDA